MTCVSTAHRVHHLLVCLFVFLLIYSVGRLAPINDVCVCVYITSDEERNEEKYFSLGLVAGFVTSQRGGCSFARLSGPHSSRPAAQSTAGRFPPMRGRHLGRAPRGVVGSG